jgi:hypothetical protein
MFSDAVAAFINRDAAEADGLLLVFRELTGLCAEAGQQIEDNVRAEALEAGAGLAAAEIIHRLRDIGAEVLAISHQVNQLCRREE